MVPPRPSLEGAFPGLSISSPKSSPSSSAGSKKPGLRTIKQTMSQHGWPTWRSIRGAMHSPRLSVRLKTRAVSILQKEGLEEDPEIILSLVRTESARDLRAAAAELGLQNEKEVMRMIFASNYIEAAGNNIDITIKICEKILRNENFDPEDISDRDPDYAQQRDHLIKILGKSVTQKDVVRSRREIVQHARAFNYVSDYILNGGKWGVDIIQKTHAILHEGMDGLDFQPGAFREHACAIRYGNQKKSTPFIRWEKIPEYMDELVAGLNKDIIEAEDGTPLDVYDRAARLHHLFINIHPFADGNGRVVRMLTAAFTLHYAGHIIVIGENEQDRDAYLEVCKRAGKKFHEEDMEVSSDEQVGHDELCDLLVRKSKNPLDRMRRWANERREKGQKD